MAVTTQGLTLHLLSDRTPRSPRNPARPHSVTSLFVFSLCSLWSFQNKCVWNLPKLFHFSSTVCQPDNSRHVIQGLVKCFIQQSFCYINYSFSTTQSNCTLIIQPFSAHSSTRQGSRKIRGRMGSECGLLTAPCPQLPFLAVSSLSRAL